eukprot:2021649-Alexandrium_andersonii.AAC.1
MSTMRARQSRPSWMLCTSTPQLGRLWVDVACVSAQAGDAQRRLAASRRGGTAAERAADYKLK